VCSTDFDHGVNEIEKAGLTALPSLKIRPPRIAEAPVQMECRLDRIVQFGNRHSVVFGEVVLFHFHDGLVNDRYHVDPAKLAPIGRLSGSNYARLRDMFRMDRPFIGEIPQQLT
jgi:flavin reductase (DIM6/NTAB) family NADH-FMN oxidoreductase RutF